MTERRGRRPEDPCPCCGASPLERRLAGNDLLDGHEYATYRCTTCFGACRSCSGEIRSKPDGTASRDVRYSQLVEHEAGS